MTSCLCILHQFLEEEEEELAFSGLSLCTSSIMLSILHALIISTNLHWVFPVSQLVKNLPVMQETLVQFLGQRRDRLPTPVFLGFPVGSNGKESTCNAGDLGSILGLGRFPGEGNSYPLQYSCLDNSMERGAWQATVHGSTKSDTTE